MTSSVVAVPDAPRFDPRHPFLLTALLLFATRLYFFRLLPFASEDAYITFRYARNFAAGLGPVYNVGERVFGYTSPLWMAWTTLGIKIGLDPVLWARLTTLALELGALFVGVGLIERHAGRLSAWAFALFYAGWVYFAALPSSGLENPALFALLVLGAGALERGSRWTGPVLAAIALLRPEGVVAAIVLALFARGRDRFVAAGLAGAGWLAAGLYYGSPIPQSLLARANTYGTPGPWAGRHWWDWIVPAPLGRWSPTSEGNQMFPIAVVTAPAVLAGAIALARRPWSSLTALGAAGLSVWLGYAIVGVAYFPWSFVLPLGTALVLASVGLPRITRGLWIPAALGIFVLGCWSLLPQLQHARAQAELRAFSGAIDILGPRSSPGQTVFLEPIGMIGWACPLRIVDEVGLVSPAVARRRREGPGWFTDTVARVNPEWLVVRRGVVRGGEAFAGVGEPFRSAAERDSLFARYRLVGVADRRAGELALEVRQRVGGP
ncbi:MAG: hypothetical protein ACREOU_00575 [Candidatus Eiseniibacteriota bacterium]